MKRILPGKSNRQSDYKAPAAIDPKWARYYRVLLTLRERLLKTRGEKLAQASQPLEPHSMDMADSATDEFDHDMALCELSAGQDSLFEIEEALKRILNGSYGVCEQTGKPISAARLRAIPWARFSKAVEDRLEQKGDVSRAHLGEVASVRGAEFRSLEESETPEEKTPEPPPKDEALWPVDSPPGEQLSPRKTSGKKHKRTRVPGGAE